MKRTTEKPKYRLYINGVEFKSCSDLKLSLPPLSEEGKTPYKQTATFTIPNRK